MDAQIEMWMDRWRDRRIEGRTERTNRRTEGQTGDLRPPVVGSVKMNFLASRMLSGVTGSRRPGCHTFTLFEKPTRLNRSAGRRSFRMLRRASLVWRRGEEWEVEKSVGMR